MQIHRLNTVRDDGTPLVRLRLIGTLVVIVTAASFGVGWAGPATAAPASTVQSSSTIPLHTGTALQSNDAEVSGSTTTLVVDAKARWVVAARGAGPSTPAPDLSQSLKQVGINSHGPWINLSYTAQKVILASAGAFITQAICRIPEVGWALCALTAVTFAGVFELLKAKRICPPDKPVFKLYLSSHPSYCE